MDEKSFRQLCCNSLIDVIRSSEPKCGITTDQIYCVWMCKTLQNNKGLFATSRKDGLYFECTYNGDKKELYVDVYKKEKNISIHMGVI